MRGALLGWSSRIWKRFDRVIWINDSNRFFKAIWRFLQGQNQKVQEERSEIYYSQGCISIPPFSEKEKNKYCLHPQQSNTWGSRFRRWLWPLKACVVKTKAEIPYWLLITKICAMKIKSTYTKGKIKEVFFFSTYNTCTIFNKFIFSCRNWNPKILGSKNK